MDNRAPAWVVPVMRVGYAARGLIYLIVGGLALAAATRGGQAEGTQGALAQLRGTSWGTPLLWVIAVGLFAYAIWRLIDGAMDLEEEGSDAKGWLARIGQIVTGLIHAGLGVQVIGLASGKGGGGSGGESARDWTAKLMSMPYGIWIVGIGGLIVIGSGIYYISKGVREKYKEDIRLTRTAMRLEPVMKAGLIAHGIVIAIVGGFFVYAALTANPDEAGGVGQAFQAVRQAAFGRILLGLLAAGLVAFGIFCFIEAIYRIVPRRAGGDMSTLAAGSEIRAQVRRGLDAAKRAMN